MELAQLPFGIGAGGLSPAEILLLIVTGLALGLVILVAAMLISARRHGRESEEAAQRAAAADARLAEIGRTQAELHGRMGTMAEIFGTRQAELNKAIGERLDGMTTRLGHSITEQTKTTHENLAQLQERLAVIDSAQGNIQALAGQVVQLQQILSNKQTRGAFGQSRMETIVADGLAQGSYTFQATLSNGTRPDCVIRMPNEAPDLVIDAKFPLEAWHAIKRAGEEGGADAAKAAQQAFRRDVETHVKAISEKYLINGETQDTAFMFVPSESIFAEIHENFESLVQKAHRARVVIVSPSLLMLSIQVIQSVLKDAGMREQAHLIQGEVAQLMADLGRLDERVRKLQSHFGQATRDVEMIVTSSDKLARRGARIEELDFEEAPAARTKSAEAEVPAGHGGSLRLRVVDDD